MAQVRATAPVKGTTRGFGRTSGAPGSIIVGIRLANAQPRPLDGSLLYKKDVAALAADVN